MEICLEVKGALGVHLQLMTKELGIIKEEGPHLSLKLFTLYGVPGESLYLFVPAKNILPILELNSFSINTKSDVPEFCSHVQTLPILHTQECLDKPMNSFKG